MHRITRALAAAGVIMLAGCAGGAEHSTVEFHALFASAGGDYEPVATTQALAAKSAMVVEGRATAVSEGRQIGDRSLDLPARSTVLVTVAVDRAHKGAPGRTVFLELPSEGQPAAAFAAALPKDLRVLLYGVVARAPDGGEEVRSVSAEWARAGQVWRPVNPQGLVLFGEGDPITALDDRRYPGATVADFRPSAGRYPAGTGLR